MLIICCWHNYASSGVFRHGYLAVEFFFILSGFLIYKSFSKPQAASTIDYTINKFRRFAPEYLIVLGYIYLRHLFLPVLAGNRDFDISFMMKMFPEILMLQDSGFYDGGANAPLWYLCILLVGGGLLYSFFRYNKRLATHVIIPLICLMGYTYLFGKSPNGSIEVWDVDGPIKATLVRGMAGMSLGILLACIYEKKCDFITKHHYLIDSVSIVGIIILFFVIITKTYYDKYILLFIPPVLLACFNGKSLINKVFKSRIWLLLGGVSFEMLLLHFRIAMPLHETLMEKCTIPIWLDYFIYCILTVIISYLFKIMYNQLKSRLSFLQ